jgi:broad specificity phosphatase PhoE
MAELSPRPSVLPLQEIFLSPAPPEATEILLVRHGQQEVPTAGATTAERTDPPLSATGRRQAKLVAAALADEEVGAVYTSTLSRARDTGAAIAAHHDLNAQQVPGIEEIRLFRDRAPGATTDTLDDSFRAGAAALFARDRSWDAYPLSESSRDFRRRVITCIENIVAEHPGEVVVVACHGGVINAYLGWLIGVHADMWFRPAHASINRFRALGTQRSLISINERNHLSANDHALVTY